MHLAMKMFQLKSCLLYFKFDVHCLKNSTIQMVIYHGYDQKNKFYFVNTMHRNHLARRTRVVVVVMMKGMNKNLGLDFFNVWFQVLQVLQNILFKDYKCYKNKDEKKIFFDFSLPDLRNNIF